MLHIERLPLELTCQPQPFVVLSGLDTENNSVHRSIWRAFTTGRGRDHGSFKFVCLPIDHQFPKPKLKPPGSYEWSLPKGILKTGWMRKHLEVIPAVVAVFFDLDWGELQWEERTVECAQRVESVRSRLADRECTLVVILIQKRAPLPLGDDPTAMERAQSLCSKCDLPVKNLFVLSPTNHLLGCVTRLENEFRNIATAYYHERAKKVKSHKDTLNKAIHQLLFVRHEFKIAFFGELKQDPALALKHYLQAYNHLLDLRMIDIHLLELKTVASFINYKICRLSFQSNASDAISQFRRHIDFFSGLMGMPQLSFEHEAWLSKQFEILGDLFQNAIRSSLTALITQHPGLYYQEAARHSIARRELCRKLCAHAEPMMESNLVSNRLKNTETLSTATIKNHLSPTGESDNPTMKYSTGVSTGDRSQSPLSFGRRSVDSSVHFPLPGTVSDVSHPESATEQIGGLEFYGQRPWRQGIQSIAPPSQAKELEGIRELQLAESRVDHSEIIIPLLEQAHYHYQRFKADRMKLYPLILMCQEYYLKGDYDKALSCYSTALSDYRRDKWWPLYTTALQGTVKCAYLSGQVETFVSSVLELIGPHSQLDRSIKINVQRSFFQLLQSYVPDLKFLLCDLESAAIQQAEKLWNRILSQANGTSDNHEEADFVNQSSTSSSSIKDVASNQKLLLDVSRLPICIDCRVAFARYQNTIDRPVQFAVFLRSHAPLPFLIRRLTVDFKHKTKLMMGSEHMADPKLVYQTSQVWATPFVLEPSSEACAVLFCIDPRVLSDRIRVDSVQLDLSCTEEELTSLSTRRLTVLLSWHPSSMDGFSPSLSESMSITPVTPLPHYSWSLWHSSNFPSSLECRFRTQNVSLPHPMHSDVSVLLPSFPPTWDLIGFSPEALICDRDSALDVNLVHTPPALARDIYTVHFNVLNKECADVSNVNLSVHLTEQPMGQTGRFAESSVASPAHADPLISCDPDVLSIGDLPDLELPTASSIKQNIVGRMSVATASSHVPLLETGGYYCWPIYLLCSSPGRRALRLQCSYETCISSPLIPDYLLSLERCTVETNRPYWRILTIDSSVSDRARQEEDKGVVCRCAKITLVDIEVLTPFTLAWQMMTTQQSLISDLIVDEQFMLQLTLTNNSPFELEVIDSMLTLSSTVAFVEGKQDVQLNNLLVQPRGRVNECQLLVVRHASQDNELIGLGHYSLRWRRRSGDEPNIVATVFKLFSCTVLDLPLQVHVELPAAGTLFNPLPVTLTLENRTIYPQEVSVHLENASSFMFSGQNKARLRVLPTSPQTLSYMLLPLQAGYLALPRFRLFLTKVNCFSPEDQPTLKLLIEEKILRDVPTHIFVVPLEKNDVPTKRDCATDCLVSSL